MLVYCNKGDLHHVKKSIFTGVFKSSVQYHLKTYPCFFVGDLLFGFFKYIKSWVFHCCFFLEVKTKVFNFFFLLSEWISSSFLEGKGKSSLNRDTFV